MYGSKKFFRKVLVIPLALGLFAAADAVAGPTPVTFNISGQVTSATANAPVAADDGLSGVLTANLDMSDMSLDIISFSFNLGAMNFGPENSTVVPGSFGSVGTDGNVASLGMILNFIDDSLCSDGSNCSLALFGDNTFDFSGTAIGDTTAFIAGGTFSPSVVRGNGPPASVPEPSGLGLMLIGLAGLMVFVLVRRPWAGRLAAARRPAMMVVAAAIGVTAFGATLARAASAPPQAASAALPQFVDWRYYGNDLLNRRYQDVDQINPGNVESLQPAWVFHTGLIDEETSLEVSPIVVHGTMYVTSALSDVFALNAITGEQLWAYHPEDMPDDDELAYCCGLNNRGVAYGANTVFIARLDAVLVALNAKTGEVRWQTQVEPFEKGYTMTLAPQYADGLVIVGVSGGEYDVRGEVDAFNAATGRKVWTFYTTGPNGTWAGDSWKRGGAPVWTTPAVDPKLGLVYVTTGNAAPDLFGGDREGKNLYANSIVALDLHTGEVRWYFQEVHHDIWDYDGPQPPVLFTLHKDGNTYPALGHCNKSTYYFILNRVTGEPLYEVEEEEVPTEPAWQHPWPTQPETEIEQLVPDEVEDPPAGVTAAALWTPPQNQELLMQPGPEAGCEWGPAAYSPRTRYVYYVGRYAPSIFQSHRDNRGVPGDIELDLGSRLDEPIPGVSYHAVVGATDTTTGKVVWKHKLPLIDDTGFLVAGDLVFYGESSGKFRAVDAKTGEILWTFDGLGIHNGGGANAAPVAYVSDGREFIAMGFGGNADDRLHRDARSPEGDAIVAFALPCGSPGIDCQNTGGQSGRAGEASSGSQSNRSTSSSTSAASAPAGDGGGSGGIGLLGLALLGIAASGRRFRGALRRYN